MPCNDLVLERWMARKETVRQRAVENSRIDAEGNATKRRSPSKRKTDVGNQNEKMSFVCFCVHAYKAANVQLYVVEQWIVYFKLSVF